VVRRVIVSAAGEQLEPIIFAGVVDSVLQTLVLHTGLSCSSLGVHQRYCKLVSLPHQVLVNGVYVAEH